MIGGNISGEEEEEHRQLTNTVIFQEKKLTKI